MTIATNNPATGKQITTFDSLSTSEIEGKLAQAQTAFTDFRHTSFNQRRQWLQRAAEILEQNSDKYARIMTTEMGKPIKAAIAEVQKCAWVCRYYADVAEEFLADEIVETDASRSFIRYQPLGVILAVMPWNFPLWQVFRFAAPALMAGNVAVLKHASNVPQCAIAIESILTEAGFPQGVFQTLLIGADQVEAVVKDDRIKAATLTGSEAAGASLAAAAGKALKKTVLELGGSDPFMVFASADLEAAASTGVTARMLNNGQSCIAAKRFIVVEAVYEQFKNLLVEKFLQLQIGDPMDQATDIGPLATPDILADLDRQVTETVARGATVLVGGKPLDREGNYYPPTILTDIPPGTPAMSEEFFGPVALLFKVKDLDEAIALANSTSFGLGASGWTENNNERDRLINEIEAGAIFINQLVKSDPRIPFGGIKKSGYGRELGSHGIKEFVNAKTVWIE